MSTAQIILTILGVVCLFWQAGLVSTANAMMRSGKYRNVKYGCGPMVLGVILLVVAVLL